MWLQAIALDSIAMDQCCATEGTAVTETAEKWLLSTWNVASVNEELHFPLYVPVIHFNLNSHTCLEAKGLKSIALDQCFSNLNVYEDRVKLRLLIQ